MGTSSASTSQPHPSPLHPRANWLLSAPRGRMPVSSPCHSSLGARLIVRGTVSILLAFSRRSKSCAGTLVQTPGLRLLGSSCAVTVRGLDHIGTVYTYPGATLAHKTAKPVFHSRAPFPRNMRLAKAKITRASRRPPHHRRPPNRVPLALMTSRANPAVASRVRSMGPARAGNRARIRTTSSVRSRVDQGMRVW